MKHNCVLQQRKQHKASYRPSRSTAGILVFKSKSPAVIKILTLMQVSPKMTSDSECDETMIIAEELARLQGQAYEANSAAHDTWKTADTVPAGSGVPATRIPDGRLNQAAGGSAVTSTPSSSVVEFAVHADTHFLLDGGHFIIILLLRISLNLLHMIADVGIVVRNKARLVAQGHRQEEGIDYERGVCSNGSYMGFMSCESLVWPSSSTKGLIYDRFTLLKKIFKYLKGQPKLGLWYPKDSPFMLEAYSDSDYAGSNGDRKSTTGESQFLVERLRSCSATKQTVCNFFH
ncbi:hypothetical protein Tco_0848213 [Tanacetum coccineum]